MKISILGDSVAKGVQLNENEGSYYCGKNGFADILSEQGTEAHNFSVFGCTVTKGLQLAKRHQPRIEGSDMVLLEFGGNDCDFMWKEIAENPKEEHLPHTVLDCYLQNYSRLVDMIKEMGVGPVLMNLPPIHSCRYFDWFSKGMSERKKQNIIDWLGGEVEYIHRWHKMYNDQLCVLSDSLCVPVIDIRSGFGDIEQYGGYLCGDGIHPNAEGQKLIYEAVNTYLSKK